MGTESASKWSSRNNIASNILDYLFKMNVTGRHLLKKGEMCVKKKQKNSKNFNWKKT